MGSEEAGQAAAAAAAEAFRVVVAVQGSAAGVKGLVAGEMARVVAEKVAGTATVGWGTGVGSEKLESSGRAVGTWEGGREIVWVGDGRVSS